jgi:hypothetical protein
MMPQDPDQSEAYWQGHFATKEMAIAYAADIEKLMALLQDEEIPRTEITRDREGGWNVWVWG